MAHALIWNRLVAVTLAALVAAMCSAPVGVGAATMPPPAPRAADDPDFALWLVRVQYCHRLDRSTEDSARIAELQAQRDAAPTSADKRKAQRELDKLEAAADDVRGHVIYGWSMKADEEGKPINATRSMAGFLLLATPENNKTIAAVKQSLARGKPETIAINHEGAFDLFTFGGRRWHRADRAAVVKNAADFGDLPAFEAPPEKPITEAQKNSIETSLAFVRSEERDGGSTLHRYTIRINCENPPTGAAKLHIWFGVHFGVNDSIIGPIFDDIAVPRSSKGTFTMSRSFEFTARSGTRMDAAATTATPIAIVWK